MSDLYTIRVTRVKVMNYFLLSCAIVVILLLALGCCIHLARYYSDQAIKNLIQMNIELLNVLVLRTEGDEQEHFRMMRTRMYEMLPKEEEKWTQEGSCG